MKKVFSKSNFIGFSLAFMLASSSTVALAGPHCKDHDREYGLERMIKHLDLTEAQETRIEAIMASVDKEHSGKKGMPKMRGLMSLNPDDADYLEQVETQAEAASEEMKANILKMAKVRQEIHAVLTDQQKQELKERIQKKMQKKMQRMEREYDDE